MTARRAVDPASARTNDALTDARRHVRPAAAPAQAHLLALQRSAGNAAVGALMAARGKQPSGDAGSVLDAALVEIRRDDPQIDPVEKGLEAAKAAGVPVELQGPKPAASALAVTRSGFGPETVAPKRPVPPPKATPATSPLGKAAAHPAGKPAAKTVAAPAPTSSAAGGSATATTAPLAAEQLDQPPVAPAGTRPDQDPAFRQVAGSVASLGKATRAHPPAAAKAAEAQAAAVAPADDLAAQAKAAKADTMDAQQPGAFDKRAFIAAVKTAIEAKSPKTLSEADDYAESGKAGQVKGEVKGLVTQGKDGQTKDIATATDAPPDTSTAVAKPVTPMAAEPPGPAGAIAAAGAAPKPAPAEQLNLAAGKRQADQELAGADVTEPQLAQSNEPEFQQALADKNAAAAHADSAPAQFRQQEQQVIADSRKGAEAETSGAVAGMQGGKAAALASLVADKGKAKTADEAKRAEVTTKIQGIFTATETEVRKILDGIDPKVEAAFDQGEAAAKTAFENYVTAKMSAFKQDRYSGWTGGLKWAKDKLLGMPDKVNEFYAAGRELYLKQMDGVISRVADIVGGELTAAKQRIASGRAEISSYVKRLPADLKKVGADATAEINDRFEQLESDVNAKQDSVVDAMATKYTEARKGLDDRIDELQAENKGLVDKAIDGIKGVINTIRELAAILGTVLARAGGVVGDIIKAPVAFLGNLVAGVKGGVLKFADNILDHLRKGLMSWLFGTLAQSGVELPETFDLKGVIKLLASVFGLTWTNIRNRLVKQIGEKAMGAAEKGVEIFQIIAGQGVAGLWQMLVEKLGDIKEMILDAVKDFVVTKVIMSGITWLIGLLNPAAAFIKACKLIYDVIMFFVNNAGRIMAFVNTIIDSTVEIVKGNVGSVVDKINDVLGKMVPILIGFLASVLGLGGIGEKIRGIIGKLQKPINKAMDFIIKKGLKLAGPIIRGMKGISSKVKSKVAAGKAWVRGKVDAGKKWVGDKAQDAKRALTPGKDVETTASTAVKEQAHSQVKSRGAGVGSVEELRGVVGSVEAGLRPSGLKSLALTPSGQDGDYDLIAEASPRQKVAKVVDMFARARRKADVTARATITFQDPPDTSWLNFPKQAVRNGDQAVLGSDGRPVMEPAGPAAGVAGTLVAPPQAGARTLETASMSGKTLRKRGANVSHAEFHSANFITDPRLKSLVTDVKITMQGKWSPCRECAGTLAELRKALVARAGAAGVTCSIDCSGVSLHGDWAGDPSALRAALGGWAMADPKPAPATKVSIS